MSSLCALGIAFATNAHAQTPGQVVTIENGKVSGTVTAEGRKFLGIPYAKPPTGSLRWKAPEAPQNWTTTRPATQVSSTCPQPPTPFGVASQDEDCLYLNVYTPPVGLAGGALRNDPVLVWIHPGAFLYGGGSDFDPRQLVARNLVVVTFNYRLGALGWLSHPSLTAEGGGSSGNYGFLDQQAVLRWVKRNISKFGGNPDKVTIGGESAGGLSAHTHLVAPSSNGLYHRAIVQSGTYTLTLPTVAQAEALNAPVATALGCTDAACLRSKTAAQVLAAQGTDISAYLPRVDGSTIPLSLAAAFASGNFNKVNVLEGSTHDEFTLFITTLFTAQGIIVTPQNYLQLIGALLRLPPTTPPAVLQAVAAQYPLENYTSGELALAAIGTDAVFACNTRAAAQLISQHTPLWWYEFDDPDAPQLYVPFVGFDYGAYHGSELQYLFDVREPIPGTLTGPQQQLSNAMVLHWSNFVRLGNPNTLQTSLWPRYQPPVTDRVQLLTPPQPQAYTGTAFATDHKCAFWTAFASGGS